MFTLNLRDVDELCDVSMLGGVHNLALWSCNEVSDISALSTVYHLTIHDCKKITSFAVLSDVHTFETNHKQVIDDVTHFASVGLHTLRVRDMPDMKSQLTNTASLVSV